MQLVQYMCELFNTPNHRFDYSSNAANGRTHRKSQWNIHLFCQNNIQHSYADFWRRARPMAGLTRSPTVNLALCGPASSPVADLPTSSRASSPFKGCPTPIAAAPTHSLKNPTISPTDYHSISDWLTAQPYLAEIFMPHRPSYLPQR